VDLALGLGADGFSMGVLSRAVQLATKMSYGAATIVFKSFCGWSPSHKTIEEATLGLGSYAAQWGRAAAGNDYSNPISRVEGKAVHLGDGLFGLPKCPFARSIANCKQLRGNLPESYAKVTEDYNKPHWVTKELHVGQGAGVSPFCAIHQPLRSALAKRIKIGDTQLSVYQLGCKSGGGKKALAKTIIEKSAFNEEIVAKVLDEHMCCYAVIAA